jgi:hypothetical protein
MLWLAVGRDSNFNNARSRRRIELCRNAIVAHELFSLGITGSPIRMVNLSLAAPNNRNEYFEM